MAAGFSTLKRPLSSKEEGLSLCSSRVTSALNPPDEGCVAVSGKPRPELDIDMNQGYPSPGNTLGGGEPDAHQAMEGNSIEEYISQSV